MRQQPAELSVNIKDCEALIRHGVVGLPGGLTKSGSPIILFPNTYKFNEVLETDLQLLLKYYVAIIPRQDQVLVLLGQTGQLSRELVINWPDGNLSPVYLQIPAAAAAPDCINN